MLKDIIGKIQTKKDKFCLFKDKGKTIYLSYMRESNKHGTFERQDYNIYNFIKKYDIELYDTFTEYCSGLGKTRNRTGMVKLFKFLFDNFDNGYEYVILIDSIDRFSRNRKTSDELIKLLSLTNCKLYFIKEELLVIPYTNYNVEEMNKYVNDANIEIKNFRYRIGSGYRAHLERGGQVGRKVGYRKPIDQMKLDYPKEIELLRDGDFSLRKIQSMTGTSVNTLQKLKKMFLYL